MQVLSTTVRVVGQFAPDFALTECHREQMTTSGRDPDSTLETTREPNLAHYTRHFDSATA
jgi:hypothetical protein